MKVYFGPSCRCKSVDPEIFRIGNFGRIYNGPDANVRDRVAEMIYHHTPFMFNEITPRERLHLPAEEIGSCEDRISWDALREFVKKAGPLYRGREIIGEYGGMLFWPTGTMEHALGYQPMPPAGDLVEAEQLFHDRLKEYSRKERQFGFGPLIGICSGLLFPPKDSGVFDEFELEMWPGGPERMSAAFRGAARAYGMPSFRTLIAQGWYGGGLWDGLYLKRFRNVLHWCYLAGYDYITIESGHYGSAAYGNSIPETDPMTRKFRDIMAEFTDFCNADERPEGGPATPMAFMRGNLDGWSGMWTHCVWGQQNNPAFHIGEAERGWNLTAAVFQKQPWHDNLLRGESDLSGQPPCGQYDIVPPDTPATALARYKLLTIPGWNTMTDDLYNRLILYVKQGGTLVMTLAQMRKNLRRDEPVEWFKNGDFRELFGVRFDGECLLPVHGLKFIRPESGGTLWPCWGPDCDPKFGPGSFTAGYAVECSADILAVGSRNFEAKFDREEERPPVIFEHSLGKGRAILINSISFPGAPAMFDLERTVLQALMRSAQPENLPIAATDKIRYAVYGKSIYVMNSDTDFDGFFRLGDRTIQLAPCSIQRVEI